jgi:hypothetical protein
VMPGQRKQLESVLADIGQDADIQGFQRLEEIRLGKISLPLRLLIAISESDSALTSTMRPGFWIARAACAARAAPVCTPPKSTP